MKKHTSRKWRKQMMGRKGRRTKLGSEGSGWGEGNRWWGGTDKREERWEEIEKHVTKERGREKMKKGIDVLLKVIGILVLLFISYQFMVAIWVEAGQQPWPGLCHIFIEQGENFRLSICLGEWRLQWEQGPPGFHKGLLSLSHGPPSGPPNHYLGKKND